MLESSTPRIVELSPEKEDQALRLVLVGLEESQVIHQVAMLRASVRRQPLSGYRTWGAFRGQELVGAILLQTQPGRTAVVWPPRLDASESPATAKLLLQTCIDLLSPLEFRMAQALLPADAGTDAELLAAAGFQHVSDLLYLVCLSDEFPASQPCPALRFEPYSSRLHKPFASIVNATYEDSCDCPAVNGVRSIDEILEGYRATGSFDPQRWFLVSHQDKHIGCLILTDYSEHATWELIYMGLEPSARGHGWGVEIVRHAQWLCGQALRNRLVLAVDAANDPALRMYAAAGFRTWDKTSVFIRVLNPQNSGG
jgi:mycothiol synthase